MTTVTIDKSSTKDVPEKYVTKARETLKRVEDGNAIVTPITDINAI